MKMIKAHNLNSRKGNPVPNQIVIIDGDREIFQSYGSIIAIIDTSQPSSRNNGGPEVSLDREFWNYSRTTARYRGEFLGENTAETRGKIKSGAYLLRDLNKRGY